MKKLVYLASPYTHDDPAVRLRRFELVTEYAARLLSAGSPVFSPITHGHPIFVTGAGSMHFETWQEIDEAILSSCAARMVVLRLEGWDKSHGIKNEMEIARRSGVSISFVDYCERCQLFIGQFSDHSHEPAPFDAEELARLRQKMRGYGEGSQSPPARDLARLLELEAQERQLQETTR